MTNKIYSLWISGKLKPINLITIRSFQKHGHEFILYSYDVSVTDECEVRDARLIMPESEIFYYKQMLGGNPNFKFGGIAERLKAEMLFQLGGWHVDLDVTCLKSFFEIANVMDMSLWRKETHDICNFTGSGRTTIFTPPDYVLRPHEKGVVGNIIKAPKHSELARRYVEHTKTIDENNRIWEKSFMGLNKIVSDLGLEKYIVPKEILGDDSSEYWERFLKAGSLPNPELHAIHHCGAMAAYEKYEKGSYFETLLKEYNLL